jgi:hypothetical protein
MNLGEQTSRVSSGGVSGRSPQHPEIRADRRQRDVHNRRVENDHQITQAQHQQRQPASPFNSHGRSVCR